MPSASPRTESLALLALLAMTAVWGSTFFLIKDISPDTLSPWAGLSEPGAALSGQAWLIVIYLAIVAGALTMVLQTWAQARVEPSRAAVIMAMEPVWAAAFAVGLGGESITVRMIIGGLAIVAAMYLAERAPRREPVREFA